MLLGEIMKSKNTNEYAISIGEFEKKVEIEAQNMMYFEYMKKEKALMKAREVIAKKYNIQ